MEKRISLLDFIQRAHRSGARYTLNTRAKHLNCIDHPITRAIYKEGQFVQLDEYQVQFRYWKITKTLVTKEELEQ